jgi:hypothetical protein
VPLTFDQFHYAFANVVSDEEAKAPYDEFAVPGSGEPIFQAAAAILRTVTLHHRLSQGAIPSSEMRPSASTKR